MRCVFHSMFPCPRDSRPLHFFMMCFNIDLSSWRLVLELFLREDVSRCEAFIAYPNHSRFRSSLVRFFLDSVFRSSPGPLDRFRMAHQSRCSFRFTRLRLCVSVVLTLVTSVSIHTRHLCARQWPFCVCWMLLFVTSSDFFTVRTLFFISATCFSFT